MDFGASNIFFLIFLVIDCRQTAVRLPPFKRANRVEWRATLLGFWPITCSITPRATPGFISGYAALNAPQVYLILGARGEHGASLPQNRREQLKNARINFHWTIANILVVVPQNEVELMTERQTSLNLKKAVKFIVFRADELRRLRNKRIRQSITRKIKKNMLLAPKSTMQINSFVRTVLPSPRDYYARYGFRQSSGVYLTDSENPAESVAFSEIPAVAVARADSILRDSFENESGNQ